MDFNTLCLKGGFYSDMLHKIVIFHAFLQIQQTSKGHDQILEHKTKVFHATHISFIKTMRSHDVLAVFSYH